MNWRLASVVLTASFCARSSNADDLLYRYECDLLPYDPAAGWIIADPCRPPCSESLRDGFFVLTWTRANNFANYDYSIANPGQAPPASLWVEWRFRSNHPLGPIFFDCDGEFVVDFRRIHDLVDMYGDAVISFSGDDYLLGLELDEFHTYRFESPDGSNYWFSVDGIIFYQTYWLGGDDGFHFLQMRGGGLGDEIPNMVNMWDYVRFGTIAYGEEIVETDPPKGFVDAHEHAPLDRFTVRYDTPNYVYLDEIAVQTTSGPVPVVTKTRRLDNGPPDVVEIVLDRPIPYNARTRFKISDGEAFNIVEFTFAPGDTDGDGDADLFDFAAYQNCLGINPLAGGCLPLDVIADGQLRSADFAKFISVFSGP